MSKDEAIHKALKVLNCLNNDRVYETAWVKGAINAWEETLAQPAQGIELEWYNKGWTDAIWEFEWLSDDEIGDLITHYEYSVHPDLDGFARAIEQALKDKNTWLKQKSITASIVKPIETHK